MAAGTRSPRFVFGSAGLTSSLGAPPQLTAVRCHARCSWRGHNDSAGESSDDEGGGERWAWEQEGQEQEGSISGALPPPSHHESEVHDPRPKGPRGSSSLMDVASGKNRGPDDSWDEADGKVGAAGEEEGGLGAQAECDLERCNPV